MTRTWYVGIFGKSGRINKCHDLDTLRINNVSGNLIFHASEKVQIGTNTDPANQCTRCVSWSRVPHGMSVFSKNTGPYHMILAVLTHLFGTSNLICSRSHPPLLFSGLGLLFLLFMLLFSQPILLNLTIGAWRLDFRTTTQLISRSETMGSHL